MKLQWVQLCQCKSMNPPFSNHLMVFLRRIPHKFLVGIKKHPLMAKPDAPLIAFVNARAGSRSGVELAAILYRSLGLSQVVRGVGSRIIANLGALGAITQLDSPAEYECITQRGKCIFP